MERGDLNPNNELNSGQWVDDELARLGPDEAWQPDLHRGLTLLRERRGRRNGRRLRWNWVVAGAMATCVSLMATPVTRAFAQRCLSACLSGTGWVRQFLTAATAGPIPGNVYIKAENRTMTPDFILNDSSSKPVRLSQLRGNVVLLNFWATWCAPCAEEIPMFIGFQEAYHDRGFVVLGVALDEGGWNVVRPYAKAKRINYPVMVGDERISDLFGGLKAVPMTFIIDKHGRIAATHIGICQKSEYEGDIEAVLNE
jgi:thiol-disulfide isomerase/thioredoxin